MIALAFIAGIVIGIASTILIAICAWPGVPGDAMDKGLHDKEGMK